MNKLTLSFVLVVNTVLTTCPTHAKKPKLPRIVFKKTEIDIGTLLRDVNPKKQFTYVFKNKGKEDLYIKAVLPDCSCTAVEYSKEPVKPKETGEIMVTFDGSNISRREHTKHIVVLTNAEVPEIELSYKVNLKSR